MVTPVSKTVLVINCGSSSVKFAIMDPNDGHVYLSGIAEAMTLPEAFISWRFGKEDKQKSIEELGDFLFSVINAARLYHLNPDNALEHTNQKFIKRFNYIEDHSLKLGKPLIDMTLEEMDKLWAEAKNQENK